jgi:group I intron endonuclease
MYKLYKITNTVNQKLYIGITKLTIEQRWSVHIEHSKNPRYPLQHAIKKYGPSNFQIELLEESDDRAYISELEEPTILKYNSRKNGYNVATGGYGGDLGPEAAEKRRRTILTRSVEEKNRLAKQQRIRQTGKTKENDLGRKSQAEKIKGNQFAAGLKHSAETKAVISAANKKPKSRITRQKMSDSAIINDNGKRFEGYNSCCLCCKREFNKGNLVQHLRRMNKNEL